ncbi:response regulator [Alkalilimnicola ehrlichii]|uniref:response regulator n=1 Tax=Alkalilimnicola ehrlichii TaxID=351052 RepID=UPI0015F260C9|nr:response regulator [Alkalilimnicola ehrlichii]
MVDDSRLARIALSKQLKKRDIEVDLAANGGEAIDYLAAVRPDVVFMDYMMPDMDGFEASRRILQRNPGLPVIMYSSQDTEEDRARAAAVGIRGFLSKPSSEDALDSLLNSLGAGAKESAPAPGAAVVEPKPAPSPAAAPASEPVIPWEEIRKAARNAAVEAARNISNDELARFRDDWERRDAADAEFVRTTAETAARDAAVEVAAAAARKAAEEVAAGIAEEVAGRVGADAAKRASLDAVYPQLDQLRTEVITQLANLNASDDFKVQVKGVVIEHALPALQQALQPQIKETALAIAEEMRKELESQYEGDLDALRRKVGELEGKDISAQIDGLKKQLRLLAIGGVIALGVVAAVAVVL